MKRAEFAERAKQQEGKWVYVWGGNGQVISSMTAEARDKWINRREKEQRNRDRVKKLYEKLEAAGVEEIRASDCSGFAYWLCNSFGVMDKDHNAEMFRNLCEPTDTLKAGTLGFRTDSTGRATHMGIYDGEYWLHNRDRDSGIVREKCKWNCYGELPYFDDEDEPIDPSKKRVYILGSVRVRQKPSKSGNVLFTAHKGDRFVYLGESSPDERGCLWYAIESDRPEAEHGIAYVSAFTLDRKKYTEVR